MKHLLPFALLLAAVAILTPSCKKNSFQPKDATNTLNLPAGGGAVVDSSNQFAFKFLQTALQNDTSSSTNKLISPLSIYLALGMVYNGADAATQDSMAATLQLQGIDINSFNALCQALIQQLPNEDNEVQMTIANSIWYAQGNIAPLPSFLSTLNTYFNAQIKALNFADPASVTTINNWASTETKGLIPKVIDYISPNDLMYLLNAIYFKGAWKTAFKTTDTHDQDFYLTNGQTVSVPFMTENISTNVYYSTHLRVVELPYGGGNSFSMYIADPWDTVMPINQFATGLTATGLKNAIAGMQPASASLVLPKWQCGYSLNLQPELSALGMGIAFTPAADFSKMYNTPVDISKALHDTYIKVDEDGTTAAAVTTIGVQATAIGLENVFEFNHPFVYVIAEKQTGTVLFTGVMNNPAAQ